ncbi:MAG: hypothetical protein FWC92_05130 [Defluviitaleaceae bacterium]|nr:hypothetical protein [Defluviitaleaceae bacterium]
MSKQLNKGTPELCAHNNLSKTDMYSSGITGDIFTQTQAPKNKINNNHQDKPRLFHFEGLKSPASMLNPTFIGQII